jgi:tellurite resistance protein TerC
MSTPVVIWAATIAAIICLLAFDFQFHVRKAHIPTLREAAVRSALYEGLRSCSVSGWVFGGTEMGMEYFAGYLTEKTLPVDNLVVFLIITAQIRHLPKKYRRRIREKDKLMGLLRQAHRAYETAGS